MNSDTPGFFDRLLGRIESTPASDRLLLRIAFFLVIACGIYLLLVLNGQFSAPSATRGGSFNEGIVGTPRFVNPVLAITRADQDVSALVYSGLLSIGPDGSLENDLAESIEISADGLTYTITLRRDVTFHDGTPVTARDVTYTIGLIQDPDLMSPLRGNWVDVFVEEIDEYTLTVTLEEAYAPFIENFTLGIMPAHVWSSLPIEQIPFSQLNTEPIGSGPYQVAAARRDPSGIINRYTLNAYPQPHREPRLASIDLTFFSNESELATALQEGSIDATAYLPVERAAEFSEFTITQATLPRTFGIFFNQNRSPALRDPAAREALTAAIDREALIEETLFGYGVPITGPTSLGVNRLESEDDTSTTSEASPAETAIAILEEAGWEKNELDLWETEIDGAPAVLSLTLRTSNAPLFNSIVETIAAQWEAAGVEVVIEQFDQSGLVQSVIRNRDFQALLFGLDTNRSQDLYPFWHSSQQDDPGLNIAQYTNLTVDDLLETAHTEQDSEAREAALIEASQTIIAERPAVFLFQPTLVYVTRPDLALAPMESLGRPSDRFSNVADWYTESESLWPAFREEIE